MGSRHPHPTAQSLCANAPIATASAAAVVAAAAAGSSGGKPAAMALQEALRLVGGTSHPAVPPAEGERDGVHSAQPPGQEAWRLGGS